MEIEKYTVGRLNYIFDICRHMTARIDCEICLEQLYQEARKSNRHKVAQRWALLLSTENVGYPESAPGFISKDNIPEYASNKACISG